MNLIAMVLTENPKQLVNNPNSKMIKTIYGERTYIASR